jgi:hypothetical protein
MCAPAQRWGHGVWWRWWVLRLGPGLIETTPLEDEIERERELEGRSRVVLPPGVLAA